MVSNFRKKQQVESKQILKVVAKIALYHYCEGSKTGETI